MDATCVPADIRYPTDLGLLNEAREKTESYIDTLYESLRGRIDKPRTYRKECFPGFQSITFAKGKPVLPVVAWL